MTIGIEEAAVAAMEERLSGVEGVRVRVASRRVLVVDDDKPPARAVADALLGDGSPRGVVLVEVDGVLLEIEADHVVRLGDRSPVDLAALDRALCRKSALRDEDDGAFYRRFEHRRRDGGYRRPRRR